MQEEKKRITAKELAAVLQGFVREELVAFTKETEQGFVVCFAGGKRFQVTVIEEEDGKKAV